MIQELPIEEHSLESCPQCGDHGQIGNALLPICGERFFYGRGWIYCCRKPNHAGRHAYCALRPRAGIWRLYTSEDRNSEPA